MAVVSIRTSNNHPKCQWITRVDPKALSGWMDT